jgi:predicted ribosomally synthesized peptide with SipW-like signal peptide
VKYLGAMLLVLLATLGTLGVSYASWQQDMVVTGNVETGTWNAADYSSVDLAGAPNCTVESQSSREITFRVNFKCNNRT